MTIYPSVNEATLYPQLWELVYSLGLGSVEVQIVECFEDRNCGCIEDLDLKLKALDNSRFLYLSKKKK